MHEGTCVEGHVGRLLSGADRQFLGGDRADFTHITRGEVNVLALRRRKSDQACRLVSVEGLVFAVITKVQALVGRGGMVVIRLGESVVVV